MKKFLGIVFSVVLLATTVQAEVVTGDRSGVVTGDESSQSVDNSWWDELLHFFGLTEPQRTGVVTGD